jgi:hypothetical protein
VTRWSGTRRWSPSRSTAGWSRPGARRYGVVVGLDGARPVVDDGASCALREQMRADRPARAEAPGLGGRVTELARSPMSASQETS